ncbi:MAG: hypothetical protein D6772_12560 [Bacteroidetes bacterium]|nr:MAG: hypothetical protein D6772_12560 [Bacteroidota bacterium]
MWKRVHTLFVGWLLLLGAACNLNQDKDPIIVPVLEDEFYLDLWQELSPAGSSLVIEFETLQEEDCLNAEVLSSYERVNRILKLTLFDILEPESCIPGRAPARGEETLAGLEQGTYNLLIDLQEIVRNEGTLSIDAGGFQVETPTHGFQWRHGRIERIAPEALWGYISYANETERLIAEQQLTELAQFTTPLAGVVGYYGHFEIMEDGSFALAERILPGEASNLSFLLQYQDTTALADWLADTRAQLSEGMSLRVFNGRGDVWAY